VLLLSSAEKHQERTKFMYQDMRTDLVVSGPAQAGSAEQSRL